MIPFPYFDVKSATRQIGLATTIRCTRRGIVDDVLDTAAEDAGEGDGVVDIGLSDVLLALLVLLERAKRDARRGRQPRLRQSPRLPAYLEIGLWLRGKIYLVGALVILSMGYRRRVGTLR